MKSLTIKGQNIKADVLVGTNQVIISHKQQDRQNCETVLEAYAQVNGFEVKGFQTQKVINGRITIYYRFDDIKFQDSHKKIAEHVYNKYL